MMKKTEKLSTLQPRLLLVIQIQQVCHLYLGICTSKLYWVYYFSGSSEDERQNVDNDHLRSQFYDVEIQKDANGLGITISGFLPGKTAYI